MAPASAKSSGWNEDSATAPTLSTPPTTTARASVAGTIGASTAGDILATGTNHRGLSAFMNGDVIELETEGLGRLIFNVRDDLKRTWSRETRLDRQQKGQEGTTAQLSGKYAK